MAGDNAACFLERQRILAECENSALQEPVAARYAFVLAQLLDRSSTPVEPDDVFLGRMVEGNWPDLAEKPPMYGSFVYSIGHTTLDWPEFLAKGLNGIATDIRVRADQVGTEEGAVFSAQATRASKPCFALPGVMPLQLVRWLCLLARRLLVY